MRDSPTSISNSRGSVWLWLIWPTTCGLLLGLVILLWQRPNAAPAETHSSYALAVSRAAPSVANLYTTKIVRTRRNPLLEDPFIQKFLGRPQNQQQRQRIERSLGSAVIVSPDGFLLTNYHVIEGADEILIQLYDGRQALATVIGADPELDMAVLHVNLADLQAINIGDPSAARVGDHILAIGNPYGFSQTVSHGIISAKERYGLGFSDFERFIQTDAAVNPGSSGGALVDSEGNLIGINTAIYTDFGGSKGISLAIPVDQALRTMADLVEFGRPQRGWLGIEASALSSTPNSKGGVIIHAVFPGGPGDRAGLQRGDVIYAINGESVGDGHAGMKLMAMTRPGETVTVRFMRGKNDYEIGIAVAERPLIKKS